MWKFLKMRVHTVGRGDEFYIRARSIRQGLRNLDASTHEVAASLYACPSPPYLNTFTVSLASLIHSPSLM
jgi:hypothetical protein